MLRQDTVFVDIETTGAHVKRDRITELAILHMRGGELVSEWQTLVNPQQPIPESIQRLTGIDDELVRDYPPLPRSAMKCPGVCRAMCSWPTTRALITAF